MQDVITFLLGFFHRFPRYATRELFLAGESYGGHYVPNLAAAILKHNKQPERMKDDLVIQLKVRIITLSIAGILLSTYPHQNRMSEH